MNKKHTHLLSVLCAFLCCSFVSAFGGRPPASDEKLPEMNETSDFVTITGHINVYGSMPHTYLGIVTNDEKVYSILAEKSVLSQLKRAQGQTIAFLGVIIPNDDENGTKMLFQTLKDGKFELESWTILQK